jgi:thiamine kinase-like enzyme
MRWRESMDKIELAKKISAALNCRPDQITDINEMKAGMTNDSWTFMHAGKKLIFRMPGAGTDLLIDRKQEYEAYGAVRWLDMSDKIVFFDKHTGIKISEFIENGRACNPDDFNDVAKCITFLRDKLHMSCKHVSGEFDLIDKINFYETLMKQSKHSDYASVKNDIFELSRFVKKMPKLHCLTHIDPNCDNFLITSNRVYLLDWEYAAMQDPHLDIAMFALYSNYDRMKFDKLIDIYFNGKTTIEQRLKIYSYAAMAGLLWSNWCEYKETLGITFGEYAQKQYDYAKHYASIVQYEKNRL